MKVDVVQVKDAEFRYKWSYWSMWIDVCVYKFGYDGYLLQMSVSRTNRKKFRSAPYSASPFKSVDAGHVGDLTQMKRAD